MIRDILVPHTNVIPGLEILRQICEKSKQFQKDAFKHRINESEWKEEESGLCKHAKRELELAGLFDKDSDYEGMLGDAVYEIIKVFSRQGHSGFSAAMSAELVQKLMSYQNLTPITDNPDDWMDVADYFDKDHPAVYQCKRNPSLFSNDGGKTYYSIDDKDRNLIQSEKHA